MSTTDIPIDSEEVIQNIDDTCEEEYIEGFAPKAQEEVLSEIQDSNQLGDNKQVSFHQEDESNENDSNENIIEFGNENTEPIDNLNEDDLNETSNQLIEDVIVGAESNINLENEELNQTEESELEENNEEMHTESPEVEETDVVMKETNPEKSNIDEVTDESDVQVEACEDNDVTVDEPAIFISDEHNDNIEDNENTEFESDLIVQNEEEINDIENNEAPISELSQNLSELDDAKLEIESEEQTKKVEEIKLEEQVLHIEENISVVESIPDDKSIEPIKENKTNVNVSPVKGKDVKSLSTTYGHEENLTNGDCCICNKIVYPMEKLSTNDRLFHKLCFRCTKCKNALSAGNFTFNQGKPYCTPHYVELFKKRGRYDEVDDRIETEMSTTTDINDVLIDELPAPDTTKNMLAKFKDLQSSGIKNSNQTNMTDSSDELPAPNTTKNLMQRFTALGQEKTNESKCKPKIDIPRHTNGHSNGTSENEPVVLPKDVIRANDPGQDDRPEQGITKNLVSRFKEMGNTPANN